MSERWLEPVAASALHIARDALLELWQGRGQGVDPLDALIFIAVIHGNVDTATSGLDEQIAYGALDQPPPDALRRPISMKRIADSLGLPFETVRRRLQRAAADGHVEISAQGVVAPERYFRSEANREVVVAIDATAERTWRRLDAVGFFERHPLPSPVQVPAEHPYRAVARFSMAYALRLGGELRALCGDYVDLMLVLNMTRHNTERVGDARRPATPEGSPLIADAEKTPATIAALSRASRIPFETTRRRLHRLAERGVCREANGGYLVPAVAFALVVHDLAASNAMNLFRLYRNCAQVGAVAGWTARAPVAAGPT